MSIGAGLSQPKSIYWTNERRRLADLQPWPRNPRQIKTDQAKRLVESFDQFGQVETIAIGPDSEVYNGHQRLNVLLQQHGGDYEVDVRQASRPLTEKEREKLTVFLHKGAAGEWDFDTLANEFELSELLEWGFSEKELDLNLWAGDQPEDPGAQMDRAEELREKWQVETGQLWQLGEHRLICGDCTDKAVVKRMMGEEKAQLVWTDPPYGVNYGKKLESANPMHYRVRTIENDNLPADKLEAFIHSAMKLVSEYSAPGAAIYVACPAGTPLPILIASFVGSGFDFHWGLVWVKDQLVLGRGDYHFKHENILYGWKSDGGHFFIDDRKQTSVFEYPRPKVSDEHPTMKPVELVEHMIRNSSEKDKMVIDPFLGSGTTLIACERLGRKCRAIEISPGYCAVAIQRWVDLTGGVPVQVIQAEKLANE